MKFTRFFIIVTTCTTRSIGASMPFAFNISSNSGANFTSSSFKNIFVVKPRCFQIIEFGSRLAAISDRSKSFTNSSKEYILLRSRIPPQKCQEVDDSLRQISVFTITGKTSPDLSCHSNGNTGKSRRSPSRLLNLPFPSGFKSNGRCANCGILSSHPNAR